MLIPIIKGLDQPVESCPPRGHWFSSGQGSQFLACTRSSSISMYWYVLVNITGLYYTNLILILILLLFLLLLAIALAITISITIQY